MFTYNLSYFDLGYQDREIITLKRVDNNNNKEIIRASYENKSSSWKSNKFLDFYKNTDVNILKKPLYQQHTFCENILGATPVNKDSTEELHSKIMELVGCKLY